MHLTPAKAKQARALIDAEIAAHDKAIWALRQKRNDLVPINCIPLELLAHTFVHLQQSLSSDFAVNEEADPRKRLKWVSVLRVCHRWQDAALAHPRLWRNIELISRRAAQVMIQRAKATPLFVKVHFPLRSGRLLPSRDKTPKYAPSREALDYALDYVGQISDLRLSVRDPQFLKMLLDKLRFKPAPCLRHLFLAGERLGNPLQMIFQSPPPIKFLTLPKDLFQLQAPNLAYVKLKNIDFLWAVRMWSSLRHLEIHEMSILQRPAMHVWLDALKNMPLLDTLMLENALPLAVDVAPTEDNADEERYVVELPSITKLMLLSPAADIVYALNSMALPSIRHMSITSVAIESWQLFEDLLSATSLHVQVQHETSPIRATSVKSGRLNHFSGFQIETFPDSVEGVELSNSDDPATNMEGSAVPTLRFTAAVASALQFDAPRLGSTLQAFPLSSVATLVLRRLPRTQNPGDWVSAFSTLRDVRVLHLPRRNVWSWFSSAFALNAREADPERSAVLFPALKRLILDRATLLRQPGEDLVNALRARVALDMHLERLLVRKGSVRESTASMLRELVGDVSLPPTVEEARGARGERLLTNYDTDDDLVDDDTDSHGSMPSLETASDSYTEEQSDDDSDDSDDSDDGLSVEDWSEDAAFGDTGGMDAEQQPSQGGILSTFLASLNGQEALDATALLQQMIATATMGDGNGAAMMQEVLEETLTGGDGEQDLDDDEAIAGDFNV